MREVNDACHNCGQPFLPGDTECWHCGWRPTGQPVKVAAADSATATGSAQPLIELPTIAVYAGLTLIIAIATLLVMRSLGRAPLAEVALERTLPAGWTTVVDRTQSFSLNLPPNWNWLESDSSGPGTLDQIIARRPESLAVTAPFTGTLSGMKIVLFASGSPPDEQTAASGFLIVARDLRPGQVTPEAALELLRSSDSGVRVLRAAITRDLRGDSRGAFAVEVGSDERRIQCREGFATEDAGAFLVAACAQSAQFAAFATSFQAMVNSFSVFSD